MKDISRSFIDSLDVALDEARSYSLSRRDDFHLSNKWTWDDDKTSFVTDVDCAVQEILLQSLVQSWAHKDCALFAEESTKTTSEFTTPDTLPVEGYFITIDPINGTKRYVDWSPFYEIVVQLHSLVEGKVVTHVTLCDTPGFEHRIAVSMNGVIESGTLPTLSKIPAIDTKSVVWKDVILSDWIRDVLSQFPVHDKWLIYVDGTWEHRVGWISTTTWTQCRWIIPYCGSLYDMLVVRHYAQMHEWYEVIDFWDLAKITKRSDKWDAFCMWGGYLAYPTEASRAS